MTTSGKLREAIAEALATSTPYTRAKLIEDLVDQVYEWVKKNVPGDDDFDGRDSPERSSIGTVRAAAIVHADREREEAIKRGEFK